MKEIQLSICLFARIKQSQFEMIPDYFRNRVTKIKKKYPLINSKRLRQIWWRLKFFVKVKITLLIWNQYFFGSKFWTIITITFETILLLILFIQKKLQSLFYYFVNQLKNYTCFEIRNAQDIWELIFKINIIKLVVFF